MKDLMTRERLIKIALIVLWTILIAWFFSYYSLRSPILLQSPIVSKELKIKKKETERLKKKTQVSPTETPDKETERLNNPQNQIHGVASHYNRAGCLGCSPGFIMANGQPLIDSALTLALTPYLVNTYNLMNKTVKVCNVDNNKSTLVKVTDTGGFGALGRVADLTDGTRNAIDCARLCNVEISF